METRWQRQGTIFDSASQHHDSIRFWPNSSTTQALANPISKEERKQSRKQKAESTNPIPNPAAEPDDFFGGMVSQG